MPDPATSPAVPGTGGLPGIPGRVVVAGDWHGATSWARGVIELLPALLPDEPLRYILHTGDFGVWPGGSGIWYLRNLDRFLAEVNAMIGFVDGNHEWHPHLRWLQASQGAGPCHPVKLAERILWLPRGSRWAWHGREWVAAGGAVSVDRARRTPTRDWWPEEALSQSDLALIAGGGPADVVVAHDCPAGVPLNLPPPDPSWAASDLRRADEHRVLLRDQIAAKIQPRYWLHGHYHLYHRTTADLGYGPVEVTGLDCNGALHGNYRVLDVRDMSWLPPLP